MARTTHKLTALAISKATKPGYYGDGGNLHLQVSASGSKSWLFRYALAGKERQMGLGSLHTVSLDDARLLAKDYRQLLLEGKDPIEVRKTAKLTDSLQRPEALTFDQCANQDIEKHRPVSSRFFTDILKIRHLRILVALEQTGQISKVAKAFNVTQPAISKQLAELQRELGSKIVRRERGGVIFTPMGELLVRHAKEVLARLQRAEFDVEAFQKGLGGKVRLGAAASLISSVAPEAIRLMLNAAPSAQVSVSEGHFKRMLPALIGGEIDIMITRVWRPMIYEGVEQLSLGVEPIVAVAGRDHPLANADRIDWDEALDWPWLQAASGSLARDAVDGFLADRGYRPINGQIEATSVLLTLQLLRTTSYLAALPARLARHYSVRGEISILPLDLADVLSEVRCFWLSGEQDETAALFRACLVRASNDLLER